MNLDVTAPLPLSERLQLGLKENWRQFFLLVLVNAFVGGMIGIERNIFPTYAATVFGLTAHSAVMSFIVAFGLAKAITNYFTGRLANRFGRRNLLLAGWWIALPVPFLLIYAPHWNWVIVANVLLGISQGLTWSSTVVMKIDLVGQENRGLAMGLNEFAGYLSVGLSALATGWVADRYGVHPYPFYLGIALSVAGWVVTWLWVKDTRSFVGMDRGRPETHRLSNVFWATTWADKKLSAITQAGWVNNLNDGLVWGLLPALLWERQFTGASIAWMTAIYPAVWGIGQLFTGKLSDHYPHKNLLMYGMFLQGTVLIGLPFLSGFYSWAGAMALLGIGTALVYPTFLSAIATHTLPEQRAESLGVFRFWRDMGYAAGALLSGWTADRLGIEAAVMIVGGITWLSGWVVRRGFTLPAYTTQSGHP
jgi:MFS family permease